MTSSRGVRLASTGRDVAVRGAGRTGRPSPWTVTERKDPLRPPTSSSHSLAVGTAMDVLHTVRPDLEPDLTKRRS